MKNLDIDALLEQINAYAHEMYMTGNNQGKADASPYEADRSAYQQESNARYKEAEKAISDILAKLGR